MQAEAFHEALDQLQAALGVRLVARHGRFTGLTEAGRRFAAIAEVATELVSAGAKYIGAMGAMQNSLAVPRVTAEPPALRVSRRRARADAVVRLSAPCSAFSQAAD